MTLVFSLSLLVIGFLLLITGADRLVEGASALAVRFSLAPMVIGLTIIAFGTSTPELIVNIFAAKQHNAAMCYGNIIGSNTVNILLILGISALIRPLTTEHNTVWREIPFALLAVLVLLVLINDSIWDSAVTNSLSRGDALILLLFFIVFLTYVFGLAKVTTSTEPELVQLSLLKTILFIIFGLSGLVIGGRLVVTNAAKIAELLGISQKVIGLTIVAVGTSLPELVTSAVAAYKNKIDLAVGNVVGSNIFNIFFILGISGIVAPLPFDSRFNIDLSVLLASTIFLFFSMFTGKRRRIDRWEAALFLMFYAAYASFLLL